MSLIFLVEYGTDNIASRQVRSSFEGGVYVCVHSAELRSIGGGVVDEDGRTWPSRLNIENRSIADCVYRRPADGE